MARRQDRKVIKIEAAYGSDRQTFTVKRNYELHVRDVQEDAGKAFKIPTDEIILYWKVVIQKKNKLKTNFFQWNI
jgi:hypothetical protein